MPHNERLSLLTSHIDIIHKTLNLPKNARKGSWKELTPRQAIELLEDEFVELKSAVWNFEQGGPAQRVVEESADVSIYAAIVADICRGPG